MLFSLERGVLDIARSQSWRVGDHLELEASRRCAHTASASHPLGQSTVRVQAQLQLFHGDDFSHLNLFTGVESEQTAVF